MENPSYLSLDQIAFFLHKSPYYSTADCIEKFSCYTSKFEKGKRMQEFFHVVMTVLPMISSVCYGAEKIIITAHDLDKDIITDFKTIFSLSDTDVRVKVDNESICHFSKAHTTMELLQELLVQYTRMYPCCSVVQFFDASNDVVYVCIVANSEEEKNAVLQKISCLIDCIILRSETCANIDIFLALAHFTCLVVEDETCEVHGQTWISDEKEKEEEKKLFAAFFSPSQLLLSENKQSYDKSMKHKLKTMCASDVSTITLRKTSKSPVMFEYADKKYGILEFYQNLQNIEILVSCSSFPHVSEYRGDVTCNIKNGRTVHVDIIGVAHRSFRKAGEIIYEVFYVGNLKTEDKREFARFEEEDFGTPCIMTANGRIHSFVSSCSLPRDNSGKYFFSFLTPAHFVSNLIPVNQIVETKYPFCCIA